MRAGLLIAAALIALGGCGSVESGQTSSAAVQPDQVDPARLREAASDPRVRRFYEARDWRPAWTSEQASALTQAIGTAERHALDKRQFLEPVEQTRDATAREAGLSLAALSYADALARGRTDPSRLFEVYTVPRPDPDLAGGLNRAIEGGGLADWLGSLAPQDEEYRLMSEAYLRYSRNAGPRRRTIPAGDALRPGGSDPRIAAIAAALRADGYLQAAQPAPQQGQQNRQASQVPDNRFTPELAAAVRRLQQDYGLDANGVIDAATLSAINDGPFERARTLAVNMERRRWLQREAPATRIDVNTAAAMLTYWRDGSAADRRRVVSGQPGNETPQLGSPMFRLVANPTWTVPRSIQEEEIEPKGEGYMARNNMEWRDGWIVQKSGPRNSLGLVKFDMRNDHAIYLHDTPAKGLFREDQRQFSHGCVRVEDALGFARMIATDQGVLDQWQEASATGEETFVALPRQIPVRLLYHTAFADGGRIVFRPDPYGWDEDVAEALGLAARQRRPRPQHRGDVGP